MRRDHARHDDKAASRLAPKGRDGRFSHRSFAGGEAGDVPTRLVKARDDASYGFF
jgi:hypothetical protein